MKQAGWGFLRAPEGFEAYESKALGLGSEIAETICACCAADHVGCRKDCGIEEFADAVEGILTGRCPGERRLRRQRASGSKEAK